LLTSSYFKEYKLLNEYAAQFRLYGCRDDWPFSKIKAKINLSFSMSRALKSRSNLAELDTNMNVV